MTPDRAPAGAACRRAPCLTHGTVGDPRAGLEAKASRTRARLDVLRGDGGGVETAPHAGTAIAGGGPALIFFESLCISVTRALVA